MKPFVMAGPCALLPDEGRMISLARRIKAVGADCFRAGLWKGGTFPPKDPSVWGVGIKGMPIMKKISKFMDTATEVKDSNGAFMVYHGVNHVWTAARIMQHYENIREISSWCIRSRQVLMIKRGLGNTLREVLGIIEHVKEMKYPLDNLWIIERGISSIGATDEVRWRPDLLIIPQIKEEYPEVRVMVDVSHSCGKREYAIPMAKASIGAGADGIMVECMDNPEESPSDARQTIDIPTLKKLIKEIN